jgi:twitching motility protein PilT
MTKEIEWFFYHAVNDDLMSKETCRQIVAAIEEAGVEADLPTVLQVIEDNGLCDDVARLRQFCEMAAQESRTLGFPPESVLEDEQPAEPAPEWDAEEPEFEAGPKVTDREPLRAANGEEWMLGWPNLADAAEMEPEQALQLLHDFLHAAREAGCSDVHISAGAFPFVRRLQTIHLVAGQGIVSMEAAENLNLAPLSDENRELFDKEHDLDYSYSITEEDRYRVNVMRQRLGPAGSYRLIDNRVRTLSELGFPRPEIVEQLTTYHQGLILVTGPAGCGKSTTLGALVDYINCNRRDHIITVEDPIEVVHQPKGCNITQRELNSHTRSFGNALRAALREDPDIIVIGELRDLETIEMAIRASETGHLVIGTLHTGSATTTMDRILDVFPPNQQGQIRSMVAESLKGVICQQLLPNADGTDVVLATEIMLGVLAVCNLIREGKTFQLESTIQTGRNIGMSTMEQSYVDLYMMGERTYEQTIPLVRSSELIHQMQIREAKRTAEAAGKGAKKRRWF